MKDGLVQQIGSPLLLYDHPCNRFVAGFIGSPPMNFLEGTVIRAAAGCRVVGDGFSFHVAPEHEAAVAGTRDGKVTLGIRPEDLLTAPPEKTENVIRAKVAVIEELGAETHLYLMLRESDAEPELIARIDSHHNVADGDTVNLEPISSKIRYFDPQTGKSLIGVIGPVRMSSKRLAKQREEA